MSDQPQPKVRFRDRPVNGDSLTLTVWAGKSDPKAEVITAQIRHLMATFGRPVVGGQFIGQPMETTHNFQNAE